MTRASPDLAIGAMEIVDTLSRLAERSGIIVDGYAWRPDPASATSEYFHLTVHAGSRHSEARFSRAVLADPQLARDRQVADTLSAMVSGLKTGK